MKNHWLNKEVTVHVDLSNWETDDYDFMAVQLDDQSMIVNYSDWQEFMGCDHYEMEYKKCMTHIMIICNDASKSSTFPIIDGKATYNG